MAPTAIPSCLCWKSIVFDTGLRPEVAPVKASTVSKVVSRTTRKKKPAGENDAEISEDSDPNEDTDGESEFTSGEDSDQDGESDSDSGDEHVLPSSAVFPSFFKGKAWGYSTVVVKKDDSGNVHQPKDDYLEPPTINADYKLTNNKPGFSVYHTMVENAPIKLQHAQQDQENVQSEESDELGKDAVSNSAEATSEEEQQHMLHLNIGIHHDGQIEDTEGAHHEGVVGPPFATVGFSFSTPNPVPIYLPAFEDGSDAASGQPQLVLVPAEYFHQEYLPEALDAFANGVDLKFTNKQTES